MLKSKIGWTVRELERLRTENAELRPKAHQADRLQRRVVELEKECLQLRREVYRKADVRRQSSGRYPLGSGKGQQ